MILIALGANLDSELGTPINTLSAACKTLENNDIMVVKKSNIWLTAPVPFDPKQNWYHNAVIVVKTDLTPQSLLHTLLGIEQNLGRVRDGNRNSARVIDLDIIAYGDDVLDEESLIIPHPRMHERLFVLNPLSDISISWIHPKTGQKLSELITSVLPDQQAKRLDVAW